MTTFAGIRVVSTEMRGGSGHLFGNVFQRMLGWCAESGSTRKSASCMQKSVCACDLSG